MNNVKTWKNTSSLENDNEGLFLFPALDAQLLNCWTAKLLRLRSCSFPTCPDPATLPLGYVLHSNLGLLCVFFFRQWPGSWVLKYIYIMDLWYQYVCCGAKLLRRWNGEHIYKYGSKGFDFGNDAMIRDVIGDSHKWTQCFSLFNTIYIYIRTHIWSCLWCWYSNGLYKCVNAYLKLYLFSLLGNLEWETMKTKSLWRCDYPDWLLESMIGMSCWNSNVELEMGICMN